MKQSQSTLYQIQIENIIHEIWMNFSSSTSVSELIEIKEKMVRGHIIMTHTYLDSLITEKINKVYLKIGNTSIRNKIAKDNKTKVFNYQIMEKLTFTEKLEILNKLGVLPESICNTISKINTLRNSLAHIFNFNQSSKHSHVGIVLYKNNDIMSVPGIQAYNIDYTTVLGHLE